jgi:prevent-host-death family protein
MVMTRVGTAELKARLSEYLRLVRRGEVIVVLDRNQPIARLVPIDEDVSGLVILPAVGRLHDIPLPGPIEGADDRDILEDLWAERADRLDRVR